MKKNLAVSIFLIFTILALSFLLAKAASAAWYSLTSPANGSNITNPYPTFTYSENTSGNTYTNLCLYTNTTTCGAGTCYATVFNQPWFSWSPGTSPLVAGNTIGAGYYYAWNVYGCPSCATSNCFWFKTSCQVPSYPSAPTPANGATNVSLTPNFSWSMSDWGFGSYYANVYLWEGSSSNSWYGFSGQNGQVTSAPLSTFNWAGSGSPYGYGAVGSLKCNTNYYWTVTPGNCSGSLPGDPIWSFSTPATTTSVSSTTISSPTVTADGSTSYTITLTANDSSGGADITQAYTMINYQGAFAGSYRGSIGWSANGVFPYWGTSYVTAPGYPNCGKYTGGYGYEFLDVVNCTTSVSGNTRYIYFTVHFNSNFIYPTSNNTLSSAIQGGASCNLPLTSWTAGGTFGLTTNTCIQAYPNPATTGLQAWWRMDESSGTLVSDSISGNDGTTGTTVYNNLTSLWKFDDGSNGQTGVTAVDQTGARNAAANGTTVITPGKIGSGERSFNGTSDYLYTSAPIQGSTTFSIAGWIYRTKGSSYVDDNNWITGNNSPNYSWYSSFDTSNNLQFWYYGAGWITIGQVPTGAWHHVAIVINGASGVTNNLSGYIDGTLVKQTTINYTLSSTTSPVWIGARSDLGRYFGGYLDEVGIWSRALTQSDVTSLAQGLSYPGGATTIVTGAYQGNANYPALGNARSFNGTSSYIPMSKTIAATQNFTVTAWVKRTAAASTSVWISGNNNTWSSGFSTDGHLLLTFGSYTNGSWATNTVVPADSNWHHVAFVFEPQGSPGWSNVRSYVDGQGGLAFQAQLPLPTAAGPDPLWIGADKNWPGSNFAGSIDEVRIYTTSLSASQIQTEANRTGVAGFGACAGACGSWTQTATDTYCMQDTQSCFLPTYVKITGNVMNAPNPPGAVTVTAVGKNTYSTTVPAGQINYQIGDGVSSVQGGDTYVLNASPVTGYNVNPTNYSLAVACTDITGPTFWYNNDAGAVTQGTFGQLSPLYYGSGKVSQSGNAPGYRLENYANSAPLSHATYSQLLATVIKNSGLSPTQNPCTSPGGRLDLTNYTIFCYNNSTFPFETVLTTAISSSGDNIKVLYPDPASGNAQQTITTAKNISNKILVVFVNGSLEVQNNVTITSNSESGAVFVLNNPDITNPATSGNLLVDSPVANLDGIYVFPGFFFDTQGSGNTGTKLTGYGSLLAIGSQALNLGRTFDSATGPSEEWHYQAKYLKMYQNVLASPRFVWKELPPQ